MNPQMIQEVWNFLVQAEDHKQSSTDREFDDSGNDMEVRNFEIQAGDHKQGVRRGSQMTTKVTNKVQSYKLEITSRTARGIDKDRGQGCPEFEVQTRHQSRAAGGGSDNPGSDARAPEFWIETRDAKQDLQRCQRDRGS